MKRKWIIVGVTAALVILIIAYFAIQQTTTAQAAAARVQTTTVQRGNLTATVSAAGNVASPDEAAMAFQTSGRVAKVNVQIGDVVSKGKVLMELDTTDLELSYKSAQATLASSKANLEQTKTNLQYALKNAQSSLISTQAGFEAAKAKDGQNINQAIVAKGQLDKATVTLQQAQGAYNRIAWRGDVSSTQQAVDLQNATIDYESALANYKMTAATINSSALKAAQATLEKDQVALEQAQKNLDTQLRTAQAQTDKDQIALEQAQRNLDKARIVAPFDGSVSTVAFSVGDSAGTGSAVTVVELSNLQIKVTVAEVDIAKIKLNQTAEVTLDALPNRTYTAKVTALSPVGTITQGVVNYPVTVFIDNTDGAVRPGMTANLAIVVDQRENVLILPTRAIRTQGTQRTVTVLYKGQNILVPVTVGLTNDNSAEITSGLLAGDVVVLNTTSTRQTNNIPGGGPGQGPVIITR